MKSLKNESGRSMVEMLGVLAIIGVLSVGGIAGYRTAMERMYLNKALEVADRFALMMENEFADWDNSYYNDGTACRPTLECTECMKEDTEYFCSQYGKEYCSNFSNIADDCYWGNAWRLVGSGGFTISHTEASDVNLGFATGFENQSLCEEMLTRILNQPFYQQHLKMFGMSGTYSKPKPEWIKEACSFSTKNHKTTVFIRVGK